jgi:hypothetical protein
MKILGHDWMEVLVLALTLGVFPLTTWLLRVRDRMNSLENATVDHLRRIADVERRANTNDSAVSSLRESMARVEAKLDIALSHMGHPHSGDHK